MGKFKVRVNKETCIGCVACTSISDNFEMGEDDKARSKQAEVDELGDIKEASDVCPTNSIIIEEKDE
ncbi:MAG: ferredoxin [Nanoarchaeota archaeon]